MTKHLFLLSDVAGEPMERAEAIARYHDFTSWVYLTPVLGAFLADTVLGKYRTILSLSIVYCLGHLALAFMGGPGMSAESWMMTGLYLIALGSGGIKPCVSAHVGDQFGKTNSHWLTKSLVGSTSRSTSALHCLRSRPSLARVVVWPYTGHSVSPVY